MRDCGAEAVLVDCDDFREATALAARLRDLRPLAVDVVPAARTVLVTCGGPDALADLRREVERVVSAAAAAPDGGGPDDESGGRIVHVDVHYDGDDLDSTAELCGLDRAGFVAAHTSISWRAAFGGFAPGFCYLVDGADPDGDGTGGHVTGSDRTGRGLPAVPRLPTPRTAVPAGSVALADRFCGIYPDRSPGGWRLIGRTDAPLWRVDREPPSLIHPGDTVRFRDVGGVR